MLEIKILKVITLWVIGSYVNIDVTQNDSQGSGRKKSSNQG